ncbi:hypothetical protein ACERK3_02135 [Phycisphaerales bacterium AB-hyl4]|uniref:BRCT domain-containing protein n=1 Tax=Natronomicrosphaera hydrolytica TaxID=3242702 RepID=A0ABV4U3N8_9BACT
MARARSSGGGAATAWLVVILGIGFVVCLVLAIVFYTQVTGLQEQADQAENDLRVYVTRELESAPEVVRLAEQRSQEGAVVDQLMRQNSALRSLIGGDTQASFNDLAAELNERMERDTVLREIARLNDELSAANDQLQQAEQQVAAAQEQVAQARARSEERTQTYDDQVDELQQQLSQVTGQFEAYQQRVAEMEGQLRQQIDAARRDRQERVTELEGSYDELTAEREDLMSRIRELTRGGDTLDPPDVIQADGQLVSVQEQTNTAYINLGRADGLVLGLTFEVFDADEMVRIGDLTETDVRGKATVEVINVGDTSSRVRVVRMSRGATLGSGDQIINLIYDSRTRFRFYVYGDFDIERTGEPTESDRHRVESMVTRWGGRLAEDLNYEVDYLVLGEEPRVPDQLPPGEIDPVRIREHVEATRVYERYQELIAQAEELAIPVLNQNRFLSLIGYYER